MTSLRDKPVREKARNGHGTHKRLIHRASAVLGAIVLGSAISTVPEHGHAQDKTGRIPEIGGGQPSEQVSDQPGDTKIQGSGAGPTALQAIVVSGQGAVTEGTASYTAGEMSTAAGLPLSPKETPQSVAVVTRQQMDDQDARSLTEVLRTSTGMAENKLDTERSMFSYRGFTLDNYQYDGVPTMTSGPYSAGEADLDAVLYDRVEIVRGATGLLTGAGSPGAAVNLVRKRALSDVLTGEVTASGGSWDTYRSTFDVSTPLNDAGTVRARFVGAGSLGDSYLDRNERKRGVLFGTVEADVDDATTVRIGADYQANRPKVSTWGGALGTGWFSDGTEIDWPRAFNGAPNWSRWNSTTQTQFVNIEHEFDNGWKGEVGYTHSRQAYDAKLGMSLGGLIDPTTWVSTGAPPKAGWYDGYRDQDAISFKLDGEFDLFGRTHDWIVGGSSTWQQNYGTLRNPIATVPYNGSLQDWDGNVPEPVWGAKNKLVDYEASQAGIFTATRFSLADQIKLIAGARYTNYHNDATTAYDEVSPYAGIVYELTDEVSLYASYTDIFQPQTNQDRNGNFLDPVEGINYEVGAKASLFGDTLNLSGSLFITKQDNVAEADVGALVPGLGTQAYRAVDGAESKGFEIEANGELLPDWNIGFGYAHFNLKDRSGIELNTTFPRDSVNLFTTYKFSGPLDKLTIGGGMKWQSGISAIVKGVDGSRAIADRRVTQGSFAIVNLMARYDFTEQTSLQLNANNVFDEKYYSQISFYNTRNYGEPRSFTVRLSQRF